MLVKLTSVLMNEGERIGKLRYKANPYNKERYWRNKNPLQSHIDGARAEAAVHQITGLPWNKYTDNINAVIKGKYKKPKDDILDVGPIEVKSRKPQYGPGESSDLLISKTEYADYYPYLLVYVLDEDLYRFRGWITGVDAMQSKYYADWVDNNNGGYCLRPWQLLPFTSLEFYCSKIGFPWNVKEVKV